MRELLKERIKEVSPCLERWAACWAKSTTCASYSGHWYKASELAKCYCLGKDDTFPCPHCQDLSNWEHVHIHPAIVAELVRWWRTLLIMDQAIKLGDLVNAAAHLEARNRAAYAIYALERHHIGVDAYGDDYLVKDKPGLVDSRNALLRSLLRMKPTPEPQAATTAPAPYDWAKYPVRAGLGVFPLPPKAPRPDIYTVKATELFQAYARHLKNVVNLDATGVNADGDVILVDPGCVAEFVSLPCKAGYSVQEQQLVVKISARDLLDRYSVGSDSGGGDGSTPSAVADACEPIADWLGAALGDPSQSRGMCAQFGYSQEPELKRRGGVGPRRR